MGEGVALNLVAFFIFVFLITVTHLLHGAGCRRKHPTIITVLITLHHAQMEVNITLICTYFLGQETRSLH